MEIALPPQLLAIATPVQTSCGNAASSTCHVGPSVLRTQLDGVRYALRLAVGTCNLIVVEVPYTFNLPTPISRALCRDVVLKVAVPPQGRRPHANDSLFEDECAIGKINKLLGLDAGPSERD